MCISNIIMIPFSTQVVTQIILCILYILSLIFMGTVGGLHISAHLNPLLISICTLIIWVAFHKLQDSLESWWHQNEAKCFLLMSAVQPQLVELVFCTCLSQAPFCLSFSILWFFLFKSVSNRVIPAVTLVHNALHILSSSKDFTLLILINLGQIFVLPCQYVGYKKITAKFNYIRTPYWWYTVCICF